MGTTRIVAVFRWLAAATILSSVIWQVTDRLAHNLFRPAEYFSYFSIQGTLIAAVMLGYTGWLSWTGTPERKEVTIARVSATTYEIVIAVVYNALLRGTPGDVRDAGYAWPVLPNEIMHVWAAVLILLDWLIIAGYPKLRLKASLLVAVFPLAWLAFSVTRGIIDGWWAYWFLNPKEKAGVAGMLEYIGGITVLMIGLGWLLLLVRRLITPKSRA
ncbi:MAG: hypothetical protein RIR34_51 [Actinomycetota bacterium]|jgi:hypothetical protein